MIQEFRKKPVIIQAIKWDGKAETLAEIVSFVLPRRAIMPLKDGGAPFTNYDNPNLKAATLYIETLEGIHECSVGDMIIKGVVGECYPCKPDIFEKTYETPEAIQPQSEDELWDKIRKLLDLSPNNDLIKFLQSKFTINLKQ